MKHLILVALLSIATQTIFAMGERSPEPKNDLHGCEIGKACVRELPGMVCADGTPAFYSVTLRDKAKNLAIYVDGGGACWSSESCANPLFVRNLTRPIKFRGDWTNGEGLWNSHDVRNPFASQYNIVSIPYCTGDAHIGSRTATYQIKGKTVLLRHHGYTNLRLVFAKIKELFPSPEKAVLMGTSGGGLGVAFHMRHFASLFPDAKKYVLNDAGLPFLPQFLTGNGYESAIQSWGAEDNFPTAIDRRIKTFGDVLDFNRDAFPEIKFGYVQSYGDLVMMMFASALGAKVPGNVVRDTSVEAAKTHIGEATPFQKVFFFDNLQHVHLFFSMEKQISENVSLRDWIREMVTDGSRWENVIPYPGNRKK